MDEIRLFRELRPADPENAAELRLQARARFQAALVNGPSRPRIWKSRRPLLLVGAAIVVAASVAIVVPAALPADGPRSFVTAAWAVQPGTDGTIRITLIRTLTHQAELQADLRADGVRAYVRSLAHCWDWKMPGERKDVNGDSKAMLFPNPDNHDTNFRQIIIYPALLTPGHVIFIAGGTSNGGRSVGLELGVLSSSGPPVCDRHPYRSAGASR